MSNKLDEKKFKHLFGKKANLWPLDALIDLFLKFELVKLRNVQFEVTIFYK